MALRAYNGILRGLFCYWKCVSLVSSVGFDIHNIHDGVDGICNRAFDQGRRAYKEGWSTMIILLPLLVALVGILVYALSTNPKWSEIGRLMFACGLLAFLLIYHGQPITVVR